MALTILSVSMAVSAEDVAIVSACGQIGARVLIEIL